MIELLISIIIIFIVSLIYIIRSHKMFVSQITITGKVVIVTGANTGIGYATAKDLSRRGGRVILACRDLNKAQKAAAEIKAATRNYVIIKYLDLASFKSIVAFSKDIIKTEGRVDILINNAGIGILDNSLTEDGLPTDAQVNYFGPFLLTLLLLPVMKNLPETARIINVSSLLHAVGTIKNLDKQGKTYFERRRVYSNTKLANILFTQKLAENTANHNIVVSCCHPGAVYTDLFRDRPRIIKLLLKFLFLKPDQGAQTSIFLAVHELPPGSRVSGKYYSCCEETTPFRHARDRVAAQKLWDLSLKVCGRYLNDD